LEVVVSEERKYEKAQKEFVEKLVASLSPEERKKYEKTKALLEKDAEQYLRHPSVPH
jgi:hypothetical protein